MFFKISFFLIYENKPLSPSKRLKKKYKIKNLEFKNSLLTTNLDLDYIETLIRSKFFFEKKDETTYIITNDN